MVTMLKIEETKTETPVCPHCAKALTTILARRVESNLGVRCIYFCQHCRKVLGVSHRKGFWMG